MLKRKACFGFFWLTTFPNKEANSGETARGEDPIGSIRFQSLWNRRKKLFATDPPWQWLTADVSIGYILQPPVVNSKPKPNTKSRNSSAQDSLPPIHPSIHLPLRCHVFINLTARRHLNHQNSINFSHPSNQIKGLTNTNLGQFHTF